MDSDNSARSKKVAGLFLAAALVLTPGCSTEDSFSGAREERVCTDANNDGYCDEDGRAVSGGGYRSAHPGFWGYWGLGRMFGGASGTGVFSSGSRSSSGISSGSKGGIGSSSRSGGGSSGG